MMFTHRNILTRQEQLGQIQLGSKQSQRVVKILRQVVEIRSTVLNVKAGSQFGLKDDLAVPYTMIMVILE